MKFNKLSLPPHSALFSRFLDRLRKWWCLLFAQASLFQIITLLQLLKIPSVDKEEIPLFKYLLLISILYLSALAAGFIQAGGGQSRTLFGLYFSNDKGNVQLNIDALFACTLHPTFWGIYYELLLSKKEKENRSEPRHT